MVLVLFSNEGKFVWDDGAICFGPPFLFTSVFVSDRPISFNSRIALLILTASLHDGRRTTAILV